MLTAFNNKMVINKKASKIQEFSILQTTFFH